MISSPQQLSAISKKLQWVLNEQTMMSQWLNGHNNELMNWKEMTASLLFSRGSSKGPDETVLEAYINKVCFKNNQHPLALGEKHSSANTGI